MILRRGRELFIAATFRETPYPFVQRLLVMSFDSSTNLYVWSPKSVVADSEKAPLNSVKYQFPKSKLIGCYFHMRQAIFRRTKKDGISGDEAQIALNMMRLLSSIEGDQINEKLQEIQNLKGLTHQTWPHFWEYFSQIWLEKYPPSLWKNARQTEKINSSTKNCLERYNRRLGSKFQNTHPNIFGLLPR
ncbi:hypothetical protein HZS_2406 [Henneguya salminicola]|nr:hypothetical protein HZS_2406 [Henneguya salminicola]